MELDKIKLNPNNPRFIKDEKFKSLVKSLIELPVMTTLREIVIDEDNVIIGGNMRYRAAKEAGWKEIPTKVFTRAMADENNKLTNQNKTYEQYCKEIMIKDNVSGGEWDWELLSSQFEKEELEDWGLDIDKNWKEDDIIEDEVPEVTENPISKLGEVYQLGRHRIMCADSTVKSNVEKLMDGKKGDVGITDPPYGVRKKEDWDNKNLFLDSIDKWYINFKENCEFGLIWFCADKMLEPLVKLGNFERLLIWNKPAGSQFAGASNNNLWYSNEPILVYDWNNLKKNCGTKEYSYSVFESRTIPKDKEGHPTTKPIDLMSWLINHYSKEEQIVLDLFLGSGSTLIACEQTNRICYGMEISPAYIDVCRKRYAKFIGKENEWLEVTPVV